MERPASIFTIALFLLPFGQESQGQPVNACSVLTENPVYTEERIEASNDVRESLRLLQCAANWSSHEDAKNTGIDFGTEVYGVPLEVGGTFDQNSVEEWKSLNCTDKDRYTSEATVYSRTYIQYDPVNAQAVLDCVQSMFGTQAVICDIDQKSSSVVYTAYWRRTSGANVEAAPTVTGFVTGNVDCLNAATLGIGETVPDGGASIFCTPTDNAPVFVLNTDRGACTASGRAKAAEVVLSGKMVLNGPLSERGDAVTLADDLDIMTGPYPVNISAEELTIVGSPMIRSYEIANAKLGESGDNARSVRIQAREISGDGSITIFQAGQNGGDGLPGDSGQPGSTGGPGVGRTAQQKQVCNALSLGGLNPITNLVCRNVPAGCSGGKPGGTGGDGGIGQQGDPGQPGGHAGLVSLVVPIPSLDQFVVLVDTDISGSARDCEGMVCGGIGGQGGKGGEGGKGGQGGQGAPGTAWCDGTIAGNDGPKGDDGPKGPDGQPGQNRLPKK